MSKARRSLLVIDAMERKALPNKDYPYMAVGTTTFNYVLLAMEEQTSNPNPTTTI